MIKKRHIVLISLIIVNNSFAQKYYFTDDLDKKMGLFTNDVKELNLQTGETKKILDDVSLPVILSDMSKIIFNTVPDKKFCIYDTKSGKIDTLKFLGSFKIYNTYLVPYNDEEAIFIRGAKDNARWIRKNIQVTTEFLIDKNTYSVIDTTVHYVNIDNSVISKDGRMYYLLKKDAAGIYFKSYSTDTGELINERISIEGIDISKVESKLRFEDSKNGLILFTYFTRSEHLSHQILFDPENEDIVNHLITKFGTPLGHVLTDTGDIVLYDPKAGYVYILEKETAKLKQRIKVKPIFETIYSGEPTYSLFTLNDSLYFLPQRPENPKFNPPYNFDNIVHADVTKVQSNTSLIDMLTDDVEEAYQKGWIDNKGIYNSLYKKLEHAQKQLAKNKTKQAVNQLNAFLSELNAQKGKHVNEEAYNLLHFNAKALIKRLEE